MQACASYSIDLCGTQADINTATVILAEVFENDSFKGMISISIEESYKVVWVEQLTSLAKRIVRAAPELTNLKIEGYTDSDGDGTVMDFLIQYQQRKLTVAATDWYSMLESQYFDYDEFCEDFCGEDGEPLYSEEEFEQFTASDWPYFVVGECGEEKIVDEVPFAEPKEIDPYSEDPE